MLPDVTVMLQIQTLVGLDVFFFMHTGRQIVSQVEEAKSSESLVEKISENMY